MNGSGEGRILSPHSFSIGSGQRTNEVAMSVNCGGVDGIKVRRGDFGSTAEAPARFPSGLNANLIFMWLKDPRFAPAESSASAAEAVVESIFYLSR